MPPITLYIPRQGRTVTLYVPTRTLQWPEIRQVQNSLCLILSGSRLRHSVLWANSLRQGYRLPQGPSASLESSRAQSNISSESKAGRVWPDVASG